MTQANPPVVRVNCNVDLEICDLIVNHMRDDKDNFPLMLMATPALTHVYEGPINAEDIFNNFIKDEQYSKFSTYGGPKTGTH